MNLVTLVVGAPAALIAYVALFEAPRRRRQMREAAVPRPLFAPPSSLMFPVEWTVSDELYAAYYDRVYDQDLADPPEYRAGDMFMDDIATGDGCWLGHTWPESTVEAFRHSAKDWSVVLQSDSERHHERWRAEAAYAAEKYAEWCDDPSDPLLWLEYEVALDKEQTEADAYARARAREAKP